MAIDPTTLAEAGEAQLARQILELCAQDYATNIDALLGTRTSRYILIARYDAVRRVHKGLPNWTIHQLGRFFHRPPERIRAILGTTPKELQNDPSPSHSGGRPPRHTTAAKRNAGPSARLASRPRKLPTGG